MKLSKTIITAIAGILALLGAKFGLDFSEETITLIAGVFILAAQGFARLGLMKAEAASRQVSEVLKEVAVEVKETKYATKETKAIVVKNEQS